MCHIANSDTLSYLNKAKNNIYDIKLKKLLLQTRMSKATNKYSRITTRTLTEMKAKGEKIAMLTAYDYTMAGIIDKAGIDVILVGDSVSNVVAGHETTLPITLDQMIYHASSVVRGVKRALIIVDLPFGTYQADSKEALRSAIRIMKEAGAHAVKLEGGSQIQDSIERIIQAGIPIMGHLGLTPQSIYKFGTYNVRAKEDSEAEQLIIDAQMLEKVGCFGIVLEKIPAKLAKKVAHMVNIPIIGIGAGAQVDGQVLVLNDILGMNKEFSPRFLRRYLNLDDEITKAIKSYANDVKKQDFPNNKEQY